MVSDYWSAIEIQWGGRVWREELFYAGKTRRHWVFARRNERAGFGRWAFVFIRLSFENGLVRQNLAKGFEALEFLDRKSVV